MPSKFSTTERHPEALPDTVMWLSDPPLDMSSLGARALSHPAISVFSVLWMVEDIH